MNFAKARIVIFLAIILPSSFILLLTQFDFKKSKEAKTFISKEVLIEKIKIISTKADPQNFDSIEDFSGFEMTFDREIPCQVFKTRAVRIHSFHRVGIGQMFVAAAFPDKKYSISNFEIRTEDGKIFYLEGSISLKLIE